MDFTSFHLPRYQEIPDVGLFLEQTVRLINGYLEPLTAGSITASMVSNYVKQKLVASPVKKEYHREQIACLTFIAIAKSVLSLEDIRRCFLMQASTCPVENAYNFFCDELETGLTRVFGQESPPDNTTNERRELLRSMVYAIAYKLRMEKRLDAILTQQA